MVSLRINCEMTRTDKNELHPLVPWLGLNGTEHGATVDQEQKVK